MACGQGVYPITIEEFKDYYINDFDFSVITEDQIILIFDLACTQIASVAPCLSKSNTLKYAFLALSAYFLFKQFGSGKYGESNSNSSNTVGLISSHSMDDVSISYSLPEKFLKSPFFFFFTQNKFGMDYLQMVYPCISGNGIGNTLNSIRRGNCCG